MPPRGSQSIAGPSSTPRQSLGSSLPPYQPPSFPLNATARELLADLSTTYSTAKINENLTKATNNINQIVGDVNENFINLEEADRKQQKRKAKDGLEDDADDQDQAEWLHATRMRVERMTSLMERATRKIIDGYAAMDALETTLKAITSTANIAAATQATQASTARTLTQLPSSDDDAAPSTSNAPPPSLLSTFQNTLEQRIERYQATTHASRYSSHNSYINFKRVVHDAQNPGDSAPALPHPSKWFTAAEGGGPEPGVTATAGAADEDESDDDIAIAREKISTKCPLTLQEFRDPVTSTKCPHSFERSAIETMISQQRPPEPRRRGEAVDPAWRASVQCPVSGCDHVLGMEDIRTDPVLVRRIKRIQRAKEMAEEEEREDGAGGVESIESGDDVDDVDVDVRGRTPAQVARVKREAASRRGTGRVVEDIEDDD